MTSLTRKHKTVKNHDFFFAGCIRDAVTNFSLIKTAIERKDSYYVKTIKTIYGKSRINYVQFFQDRNKHEKDLMKTVVE